jgi:uncharacterized membrane protein
MAITAASENMEHSARQRAVTLYTVAAIVSLIGLADSIYLTVEHMTGQSVRCTVISGCSEVLSSPYAIVGGYPLALFGAVAYFTVFSLAILSAFRYPIVGTLLMLVVGLMFLTTLRLLYLQAFVIHHFCQFCLLSAAVTIALTALVLLASRTSAR